MAKKFVRGITDVKTINNQDYDTNNVNDLLSDGQHNYIHRKKGENEEYHNLTDNIKTISSDNTDLLTVTNNNKTTNTATLHPKHDKQKEQVIESTRNTITINHGSNGTDEKTSVDTNPQKVLEHEKLKTGDGLSTSFNTDETTIRFTATKKPPKTNLNTLREGVIRGDGFPTDQVPSGDKGNSAAYITLRTDEATKMQLYFRESNIDAGKIVASYRFIKNDVTTQWKEMAVDNEELLSLLAQKEQVIESTRNTVTINHGTNGTAEKTTVDTNPKKVLEHEKLKTGDGLGTLFNSDETTIILKPTSTEDLPGNNGFYYGDVTKDGGAYATISLNTDNNKYVQLAFRESVNTSGKVVGKYRFMNNNTPTEWNHMLFDDATIRSLLGQKQDKLTAGTGITIQGNTISATGSAPIEGASVSIQDFAGNGFNAWKHVVTSGGKTLVTFSFDCFDVTAEYVITGPLKQQLEKFIPQNRSVSNGAITITNDGTTIKATNSNSTENVTQQATFTFFVTPGSGGGTV